MVTGWFLWVVIVIYWTCFFIVFRAMWRGYMENLTVSFIVRRRKFLHFILDLFGWSYGAISKVDCIVRYNLIEDYGFFGFPIRGNQWPLLRWAKGS